MKWSILVSPDLFFFLKIPLAMWHLFCSILDACFLEEQRHGDFGGDCAESGDSLWWCKHACNIHSRRQSFRENGECFHVLVFSTSVSDVSNFLFLRSLIFLDEQFLGIFKALWISQLSYLFQCLLVISMSFKKLLHSSYIFF